MRKWNTILSVLMLLIFMIHGIMGSFMLNGVGSSAGKLLAWIGVGILVVHTVIGVILTVQSLQTAKQSGKMYLKQNVIFWARRASGMAILILLLFHIGLFGKVQNGTYILFPFTTVKMVTQLLFVAAIFVHIFINIRPLLVSLGIISYKERRSDIYLILSVLLLFYNGSGYFILYWVAISMSKTIIIIIGAGLAGLSAALQAAENGCNVKLVSSLPSERAQSVMAEGGINAALNTKDKNDSPEEHFTDTIKAACGLADPNAVWGNDTGSTGAGALAAKTWR